MTMMKQAMLASAMLIAAPVMAQQATTPAPAAPVASDQAATTATDPAQAAPAQPGDATATASTAQAAPASGDQIAGLVSKEFPTYDANKDGSLNQGEFGAWMVALKKASDPATTADSPATKSWIGAAFAQADKDKSKSVSQQELTGFLSQGKS